MKQLIQLCCIIFSLLRNPKTPWNIFFFIIAISNFFLHCKNKYIYNMLCITERYLPSIFLFFFINFVVPYFINMFNNLDKLCMVLNYRENRENKIVRLHTLNFNGVQNNFNNLHNPILFAKSFPVYREKQITRIIYQFQNCVFIYKQALS